MTVTLECGCVFDKRNNVFLNFCEKHKGFCAVSGLVVPKHAHEWKEAEESFHCWYGIRE